MTTIFPSEYKRIKAIMQGTEPNADACQWMREQRAKIRNHSQWKALAVLALKQSLNQLTLEDLTPTKLKSLADYFDADVLGATK